MKDNSPVKMTAYTKQGQFKFEAEVQKSMARLKKAASSSQSSLFTTFFLAEIFQSPLLVKFSTNLT